jgi:hypothetical protein
VIRLYVVSVPFHLSVKYIVYSRFPAVVLRSPSSGLWRRALWRLGSSLILMSVDTLHSLHSICVFWFFLASFSNISPTELIMKLSKSVYLYDMSLNPKFLCVFRIFWKEKTSGQEHLAFRRWDKRWPYPWMRVVRCAVQGTQQFFKFIYCLHIRITLHSAFGKFMCTYKSCWKWCPRSIVSINWIKQLHTLLVLHFNRCLTLSVPN